MTLVVAAGNPSETLFASLKAMQEATATVPTEIIVTCNRDWPTAPEGIKVSVAGWSRGDRLDSAAEEARGRYLGFVDARCRLTDKWQQKALELLQNPDVGAVGGPVTAPPDATQGQRASGLLLRSRLVSGPRRYMFRQEHTRTVPEMPTANLVVRSADFRTIGGFQSPSPLGDGARLCFKLRTLLGLGILYHPELILHSAPPELRHQLTAVVINRGRHRGDLARQLPEASPMVPYGLPAFALPVFALLLAAAILGPSPFNQLARAAVLAGLLLYVIEAVSLVRSAGKVGDGLLAAVHLPFLPMAYAVGFWRGYFGRTLGEVSPSHRRDRPLRILVFNWRDVRHPWSGGAEAYMHQLATRWVRDGCEVGWVSERFRSGRRVEVIDGIRFHRVGGRRTVYLFAALVYLLRLRGRYDVIVDCENGVPFFTPLYSRKPIVMVVHHVHQEIFRRELPRHLAWLALWLEGTLMPWVYRNNQLVAVSPSTRNDLIERGFAPEHVEIVSNGVEMPTTAPRATRSAVPTVLYLGRLQPYKSIDVVIRAMVEVIKQEPTACLEIVGQGPDRQRLERLTWSMGLARNVRFRGYLPVEARNRLLKAAWVAVCPSAFEGWGVVCMEASAHGLPVVAARVPGLRDSVIDGTTGILLPHGDSATLGLELAQLLRDEVRRERMGQAGRQWAAEHNWELSASGFMDILAGMLPGAYRDVGRVLLSEEQSLAVRAS